MQQITLTTLNKLKQQKQKFTCLTAYDASFAKIFSEQGVEILLVGDTLGCVLQGHPTTVPVTVQDMVYHIKAVARGNKNSMVIGDMPFLSYKNENDALETAQQLMQAGAHVVKLEGAQCAVNTVKNLTLHGVGVCCHLGLTPQSVHLIGGYKVQGKTTAQFDEIIQHAKQLEAAGAVLLVLECVPKELAAKVTELLTIPVIGIGAGPATDGQVLVSYDMLSLTTHRLAKFVRVFLDENNPNILAAVKAYVNAVKSGEFPADEHCY